MPSWRSCVYVRVRVFCASAICVVFVRVISGCGTLSSGTCTSVGQRFEETFRMYIFKDQIGAIPAKDKLIEGVQTHVFFAALVRVWTWHLILFLRRCRFGS